MPSDRRVEEVVSLAGERTQVTALFYDVVGSTELLHKFDPEEFGTMQRVLHKEVFLLFRTRLKQKMLTM